MIKSVATYLKQPVSIAPLVIFRIAFGTLMFLSLSRFIAKGWVSSMYIMPKIFFPYYGFEWVQPLGGNGMYLVFGLLLLASLGILLGFLYRISAVLFFLLFTYVELIDKTNYLNHYYFISLVAFLIIFVPAARSFSLDNVLFKRADLPKVPRFFVFILQLQMFGVYFFAGIAKINYDWLVEAQPLRTWLPAFSHYPLIGRFMEAGWLAFAFSWFACLYDLLIGFFLFNRRTVYFAYGFVVLFHMATALFFNIGMFPYIMMTITMIFFRAEFHLRMLNLLKRLFRYTAPVALPRAFPLRPLLIGAGLYFLLQFAMPFRYLLYKGNLFWTEQGYRFSWRVMLMEKAGSAFFTVTDSKTGAGSEVYNSEYLTYMQEKMMATQPDMMVDYAKFLKKEYAKKGYHDPVITVQSYVTVNGRGSREFIDPTVDLASQSNSFLANKNWVRSY